jgi:L-lysine exporter family protein LysE/ArgO
MQVAYFAGLGAGAGLIVAIGAQNAFVLRQGVQHRYVGTVVALCVLADVLLIAAGVGGMGLVVGRHAGLLLAVRWAGAAFLAGYGLLALRRSWRGEPGLAPAGAAAPDRCRVVLACLGFTLLNPHVYLDTVVLLGSLSTHYPGTARWEFAAGAASASLLWFCALGYGARVLQPVFRSPRAWRVLDLLVGVLMLALAMLLLRG